MIFNEQLAGGQARVTTEEVLYNVAIIAMYCHLRPPDVIAFAT